ncbi:distal tail protein Dit [Clostridium tyrobutyricum]|uniref:distal tail protein Dit n=1 Tax=Clostridium tyrobutyricum TaxID=1519 RepID=UPI0010AB4C86|nr:distal tail protein Dit [Clostridium tyrobutyricum]MBV4427159.1 phage tail family protein [Clostridium tyrobutyricum]MBV4440100.1 phage tail family protein [Clostridium tyrobutyricum]MBV4442114.1 phage tail family protein [Clostridium tyrobutyricum]MBV4442315.1 phage tail family protein [Clostridium tyrobutyricum]QCH29248.1 Phage tail protein [Clostridium tyrobutyricum]
MLYGLTFNGKHSFSEFGLYVEKKTINPPSKKKIVDDVPFMHGNYDFSTVGSGGEQVFDTRTITVKFALICYTMEELYTKYSQILEWLTDCGQSQLIFDYDPGYYFLAEVQDAPKFDDFTDNGELEVNFVCYPFRYSNSYMGDDIWDTFNFLTDYTQYTNQFTVDGETTVTMYNNGRSVTPTINCSAPMTLTYSGQTYNLNVGDNKVWGLKLQNGKNDLVFSGNGTAKILFRWEAL